MRMTQPMLLELAELIEPLDTPNMRDRYRRGEFDRADAVRDLDRRYRWDLFWFVQGWKVTDDPTLMDSHIDTALRAIVPPLDGPDPLEQAS